MQGILDQSEMFRAANLIMRATGDFRRTTSSPGTLSKVKSASEL